MRLAKGHSCHCHAWHAPETGVETSLPVQTGAVKERYRALGLGGRKEIMHVLFFFAQAETL